MLNRKTKRGVFFGALAITIAICSLVAVQTKADSNIIKEPKESTDTSSDKNIIEQYSIETDNYKGYYLVINDPTRVKIACTSKLMTEGETVSEIAENNNAVAAINGGNFIDVPPEGEKVNSGIPAGIVMSDGKLVCKPLKQDYKDGKYISSDIKDDEKTDLFAITKDGRLIVGKYSINDLNSLGAQEALSYGPSLIINGEKTDLSEAEKKGIGPRTAIGQRKDGAIIMLAIDGRSLESRGIATEEEQEVMYKLGAVNAINLAGYSATTIYYNNKVINKPVSMLDLHPGEDNDSLKLREKKLPTAIIVK